MRNAIFPFLACTLFLSVPFASAANLTTVSDVVQITEPHSGDVVVLAGDVRVLAPVEGDVLAAGGTVTLSAPVQGDVRVLSSRLILDTAHVKGDILYMGSQFAFGPASSASGSLMIQSGEAILQGNTGSGVTIEASDITFGGQHQGPVRLSAATLQFLGGAKVASTLAYDADMVRDASAVTADFLTVETEQQQSLLTMAMDILLRLLLTGLASFVLAMLLAHAAPLWSQKKITHMRTRGFINLLYGLLFFFLLPGLVSLLLGFVFGLWPLGVIFLPLVALLPALYVLVFALTPALLVLTLSGTFSAPGDPLWKLWAARLLASFLLGLIVSLPYVGVMALLSLVLYAAGALLRRDEVAL